MKSLQTNIKLVVISCLLTIIPLFTNAQKVLVVFHAGGIPAEVTLVDSNGVRIGYSNFYNSAGILTMSLMYKNGVPNGQWTRYDDKTGQLKESFTYINGKLEGEHCWFDDFGKIAKNIVHVNGTRVNPVGENIWAIETGPTMDANNLLRFSGVGHTQIPVNNYSSSIG